MGKLTNKVAVVTGAAMGNGLGISKVLAKHGAKIALVDISDQLDSTVKKLQAQGVDCIGVHMNVADTQSVTAGVKEIIQHFGTIDCLMNNAGIIKLGSLLNTSDEERDQQFDVNIKGVWNVTKAVLPTMIENKKGRICNMSSVTGVMVADEGECAYATTKAAIMGFTRACAREVAKYDITVNAILPGYIQTPMADAIANESTPDDPSQTTKGIADAVPLGKRLGTIEEVGELAAFLLSDEASYMTATPVVIDGGSTLPETVSVGAE
ncbi:SDR family oxidoreductase UcpA [Companilactobacillus suantsaicola]|uniref:SDR family oxidoreductase UcpA n=1 Tax=Companilactobacillus suantsaicola TaxID=2487723 RepID=A0A4Z0JET4_9LACO|nr:SDR family oxidoreductase UcpA [Companilactobacillus suantsaicola]TGD21175.1 SDR family oxidoreductase UcpA [Companilactobacillus suantsaicola]